MQDTPCFEKSIHLWTTSRYHCFLSLPYLLYYFWSTPHVYTPSTVLTNLSAEITWSALQSKPLYNPVVICMLFTSFPTVWMISHAWYIRYDPLHILTEFLHLPAYCINPPSLLTHINDTHTLTCTYHTYTKLYTNPARAQCTYETWLWVYAHHRYIHAAVYFNLTLIDSILYTSRASYKTSNIQWYLCTDIFNVLCWTTCVTFQSSTKKIWHYDTSLYPCILTHTFTGDFRIIYSFHAILATLTFVCSLSSTLRIVDMTIRQPFHQWPKFVVENDEKHITSSNSWKPYHDDSSLSRSTFKPRWRSFNLEPQRHHWVTCGKLMKSAIIMPPAKGLKYNHQLKDKCTNNPSSILD